MKIAIDAIDDVYFFLADKRERFGCRYHHAEQEFRFINRLQGGDINLFNSETHAILTVDEKFFDENFDIIGSPIYLGQLSHMIETRINYLYELVTPEEFARYVYLGKFIIEAWTNKGEPLEGSCTSEELFNNLIKLIGDFFDDPKPSGYKVTRTEEQEAVDAEIENMKTILPSKNPKKGPKKSLKS